ncbi:ATP-binding cassette domain-containing protein [Klebsiella pneumoniae]|nr:ATP-binding cassette domain-containing protein [Klebsiella pneumoniae]
MEPFLSLRHVSKTFHANRALNDISIDFMPGEVHCLAGQNGCGKSTLIKIISGVYRPDVGAAMTLGGKTWPKLTPAASVAHGIRDLSGSVAVSQSQRVGEHCYKPLSSRRTGEAQRTATQCGAGDAQY